MWHTSSGTARVVATTLLAADTGDTRGYNEHCLLTGHTPPRPPGGCSPRPRRRSSRGPSGRPPPRCRESRGTSCTPPPPQGRGRGRPRQPADPGTPPAAGKEVTEAAVVPVPVTRGSLVPGAGAGARVSASTRARDWMCCCRVSRLLLTRPLLVLVSPQRLYRGRLQLVTSSSPVTSVMLMAHFFSYTSSHLFSCTGISQSVMS